jgi:hypothetical protein
VPLDLGITRSTRFNTSAKRSAETSAILRAPTRQRHCSPWRTYDGPSDQIEQCVMLIANSDPMAPRQFSDSAPTPCLECQTSFQSLPTGLRNASTRSLVRRAAPPSELVGSYCADDLWSPSKDRRFGERLGRPFAGYHVLGENAHCGLKHQAIDD